MDVMTSLDEYGNINADLTEVTVVMRDGKAPSTDYSPLTRAVEVVALHQADGYSVSTTRKVPYGDGKVKGPAQTGPENEEFKFDLAREGSTARLAARHIHDTRIRRGLGAKVWSRGGSGCKYW